jgi:uncharacterized repeat protein (TIGR03803 family)
MPTNRPCRAVLKITFATFTLALLAASSGATEKVLHNFGTGDNNGQSPYAGLIFDGSGNLYGTTVMGGSENGGTVFQMSPNGSGGWTTKVLYSFGISGTDGQQPYAGLIFDGAGNLYGTTSAGGSEGYGTVFELSPNGSGGWTEVTLHNFGIADTDGIYPYAGLIFDGSGNLYGTTSKGGSKAHGAVFELTPNGSGGWTERVLHNFGIGDNDGQRPFAGLLFDGAGNLYGTTSLGGSEGEGAVFEMTPNGSGGWTERVLHNFGLSDNDGRYSYASLIFDGAGNLYGTTVGGGSEGDGAVFEMTPNGSGGWTERVLHNFGLSGSDGTGPYAGLIFDGAGNLYGTTEAGGSKGAGTAFEMTPNGSGGWTERVLHNFGLSDTDGQLLHAGLIFDGAGNLYGTTSLGGSQNDGTVFEVIP